MFSSCALPEYRALPTPVQPCEELHHVDFTDNHQWLVDVHHIKCKTAAMLTCLGIHGLGLLCRAPSLAAVIDAAAPVALLLSQSFSIGSTRLPWFPAPTQCWDGDARGYSSQQQHKKRKQKQLHSDTRPSARSRGDRELSIHDQVDLATFPSSLYTLNLSRAGDRNSKEQSRPQQTEQCGTGHKGQQQQHHKGGAARHWSGSHPISSRHAAAAGATARTTVRHARPSAAEHESSHSRQQRQQPIPDLPDTLGNWSSGSSSVAAVSDAAAISEGQLMALIHGAKTIADMEQLLLNYHANFRYHHVSAAVCRLPLLQAETSYNSTARLRRLVSLIASGLIPVAHQMDIHQITACVRALTTPVCRSPLQVPALDRLINVLMQDDGSKLWKLRSNELADLACAAAVIQRTLQQQNSSSSRKGSSNMDSSSRVPSLLEASHGQVPAAAGPAEALVQIQDSSSSSSGALALQTPLQRLWTQLRQVVQPQLDNFSAGSLSLLLHGFVTADTADNELLLLITAAALSRSGKFEDPATLTRMLHALATYSKSHSTNSSQISSKPVQQLLTALSSILAQNKSQFSSSQLISCVTALAQLQHYSEEVCLAVCKVACRTLRHWQPDQVVDLIRALVQFRYRDELLLKAVVKYLPDHVGGLSVGGAADVLVGLLQLSYKQPDVEKLMMAVLSDLPQRLPAELTPSAAAKLLWVTAVLEEGSTPLQHLLLSRLAECSQQQQQQQLTQDDLVLLYQVHRLMTDEWLTSSKTSQPKRQRQQDVEDTGNNNDAAEEMYHAGGERRPVNYVVIGGSDDNSNSSEAGTPAAGTSLPQQTAAAVGESSGWTLHDVSKGSAAGADWPPAVVEAACKAAVAHAIKSAKACRQLQQHIQDLFEEMGLEAPVQGFRVDGGALQPDLAFVAQGEGLDLKVALLCDHDGSYTRNVPFQLLGYDTVEGWLLEKAGWKVVRLTPHEWQLILGDERVHEGSALAFLYNILAAQGIPL